MGEALLKNKNFNNKNHDYFNNRQYTKQRNH